MASHLNPDLSDLTHADWWIRTTVKLLQSVDTSLRFKVLKVGKTQHLSVENVSEETLPQLFFYVNTDQNNSYGYLESMQVFLKDDYSDTPVPIPGFSTLANAIWNEADAKGFVAGQKTQTAFLNPLNNPHTNEPLSISQYVDIITAIIPWAPKTLGKVKIYSFVLNPDLPGSNESNTSNSNTNTVSSSQISSNNRGTVDKRLGLIQSLLKQGKTVVVNTPSGQPLVMQQQTNGPPGSGGVIYSPTGIPYHL
jgi:hypothetical protein